MRNRLLSGWRQYVVFAVVVSFALAPVFAGAKDQITPVIDNPSTGQGVAQVDPGGQATAGDVDRITLYARSNYVWPYSVPTPYGTVNRESLGAQGVLRTLVGSMQIAAISTVLPEELQTINKLDVLPMQYFIIDLDHAWLRQGGAAELSAVVSAAGGEVVGGMPVSAVIARLNQAALIDVQAHSGVTAVVPFQSAFKLHKDIGLTPLANPIKAVSEIYDLDITLFPGEDGGLVANQILALGGEVTGVTGRSVRASLNRAKLGQLADIQAVLAIHEAVPNRPAGEETTITMQTGGFQGRGAIGPYHLAGVNGSGNGVAGTSAQVLMVIDSGAQLDAADLANTDATAGTASSTHRKVIAYRAASSFSGNGDGLGCDAGPQGGVTHGHVVAATAVGNATDIVDLSTGWTASKKFFAPDTNDLDWGLDGVAPGAKVSILDASVTPAASSCSDPTVNDITIGPNYFTGINLTAACPGATCPGFLQVGYRASNGDGARVFNMSYGSINQYANEAREIDEFLYAKGDALIFGAVGNEGTDFDNDAIPDLGSVISPATNKNGVSVGSTGSTSLFDGAENRTGTSSIGPARVGATLWETDPVNSLDRVQPILMAPGASSGTLGLASEFVCRTNDNDQNDPVECDVADGNGGTSYSSPAAAGAALLVRDYFAQGFYPTGAQVTANAEPNISGALTKAILVASADYLNGGGTPTVERFNNEQGYGRIQLDNALPLQTWAQSVTGLIVADGGIVGGPNNLSGLDGVLDGTRVDTNNVVDEQAFEVCAPHPTLRVALAWMDRSVSGDNGRLNTDLDLELIAPDGTTTYYGNYYTDDDNRDRILQATDEDCPNLQGVTGVITQGQWSLPVCQRGSGLLSPHDVANNTEAIHLSHDVDGDGVDTDTDPNPSDDDQIQIGTWTVRVKVKEFNPNGTAFTPSGNADPAQRYAVAITGAGCLGSSVRFDSGTYSCNSKSTITVNELPETPALNAVKISDRTTVRVFDSLGALVDTETSLGFTRDSFTQSYIADEMFLTDATARDTGNGVLDVRDGDTLQVTYVDAESGNTEISEAAVDCQLRITSGAITFGQWGFDTGTFVNGGCERNARGLFEVGGVSGAGGSPDRFLDEDEDLILSVAIGSQEIETVNNIVSSLRCVEVNDTVAPEDCRPGTSNCDNPNRILTGAFAMTPCPSTDLTITNSPVTISQLPSNAAIGINYNLDMGSTITDMKEVEFVLELSSTTSGRGGTATAVFRQILDADQLAVLYSTDFPTGGSEFADWNNNELLEGNSSLNPGDTGFTPPVDNAGDFLRDYRFETRVFSDMTAGGTRNALAAAKAPWNFNTNDGGFLNGIAAPTDDDAIIQQIAQWGEDKNFNNILDGFCAIGHCSLNAATGCNDSTICSDNSEGICLFDAQGWCGGVTSGTQCTDFDDPGDPDLDPEDCEGDVNGNTCNLVTCQTDPTNCITELLAGLTRCISESEDIDPQDFELNNVWATDGGCGWQTAAAGTCSGGGAESCFIDSDCPGFPTDTCSLVAPQYGMWHTGRIGVFGSTGCLGSGNTIEQCQGIETVGGSTGERVWFELLMSPPIEKVDLSANSVNILNFAWNQAIDLEDRNVAWSWEVDGDTTKINPVDLTSDGTVMNLAFGSYTPLGGPDGVSENNPGLTNGFSLFAPLTGVDNLSKNGTLGGNRHGQNACYFEGAGKYPLLTLQQFGFAGPLDDDVNNGHCPGERGRLCSAFCENPGQPTDRQACSTTGGGDAVCNADGGTCTQTSLNPLYNRCEVTDTCVDTDTPPDAVVDTCSISGAACTNDAACRFCIFDNTTIDEYVMPNGPIRNMDLFAFNGPDLRFQTVEDVAGESVADFQAAIGIANFEKEDTGALDPATSYGVGVDDAVFEWQEFTIVPDAADCATGGTCANIDTSVGSSFNSATFLDITVQDVSPSDNDCNDDGTNTGNTLGFCAKDTLIACAVDVTCANAGAGACNDADNQDDKDCNNNGVADVRVTGKSLNETAGERVTLDCSNPSGATCPGGEYVGSLPVSATFDSPGVVFVQAQGTDNPVVETNYFDFDDGTGSVCSNSLLASANGLVQAFTTISLTGGNVAVISVTTTDNGDGDQWADSNETILMKIVLRNQTGILLNNVQAKLATNDPKIDCILSANINVGTMLPDDPETTSIDEGELAPTDGFLFRISGAANRIGDCSNSTDTCSLDSDCTGGSCNAELIDFNASMNILISADEFDTAFVDQLTLVTLDLDALGGGAPTEIVEGFEGGFGRFGVDNIDSFDIVDGTVVLGIPGTGGHGGSLSKSDGYRCSFSDPDYLNANEYGRSSCFMSVDAAQANTAWWTIITERAFAGTQSLHYGLYQDDVLQYTTPNGLVEAVQTVSPLPMGFKNICSNAPLTLCPNGDVDCPTGGTCGPTNPRATWKHQISFMDSRGVNASGPLRSADGGVIHVQIADPADEAPVGNWIKVSTVANQYDSQKEDNFFNCSFDPVDDGNDETDFFDPTDPFRRFGPSSTCFPEFSYTYMGDTDSPWDAVLGLGNATQGPGLEGSVGVGTWVESVVDMSAFRAQFIRIRFLVSALELDTTWQSAFQYEISDPREDGWFIDDFRVKDAITFSALIEGDIKANLSVCSVGGGACVNDANCAGGADVCLFPQCGITCNTISPSLVADPATSSAPGQVIELSTLDAMADRCVGGVLQYRFWVDTDENQTGFDEAGGDVLLRNWSENAVLLQAPGNNTPYAADTRCSAATSCEATAYNTLGVTCPDSTLIFPTITADGTGGKSNFQWAGPVNYAWAEGTISSLVTGTIYPQTASLTGQVGSGEPLATVEACAANVCSLSGLSCAVASDCIQHYVLARTDNGAAGGTFCNEAGGPGHWNGGGAPDRDSSTLP